MLPSASPQDLERLPFAVAIVASVTACLTAFDAFRASVLAFFTLLVPEPCSIRLAAWVMRRRRAWDTVSAVQSVGLRLSVADDGRGIARDSSTTGFGMTSMQERADRIGASLTIVTAPRNGTEVVLAWEPASLPTQVHVAS